MNCARSRRTSPKFGKRYLCAIWQLHYQKQGLRSLHLEYALLRVLPYPFQRTVFGGSVTGPAVWLRLQWLALRRVKLQRCGGAVYLMEFFCFHLCLWGTEIFDFLFESFPDVLRQLAVRPKANPFLETHSCNRHPLPRGTTEGRSSRTCEFSIHVEFQWIVKWGKSWIARANQNTTPEKIKSNGFSTQSIHVRRSAAELSDDGRSSSLPRAVCYIQQPSLLWRNAIPSAMKVCSFPAMLQFLSAALCVFLKYFDD